MSRKKHKNLQDVNGQIEIFREKWPWAKISLLTAHLVFALDETRDIYGWEEIQNLDEGEKMLLELMVDLKKLNPERREKPNIKVIEQELLKEEAIEDDVL